MGDYVLRVMAKDAGARVLAAVTTDLAREAAQRHAAYPIAAAALAYGMTAGALLGALLKVQERVALKVDGDGRLGKMIIEADAYGRVRGYIAVPDAVSGESLSREAVGEALGRQGILTVVKDMRLKDLYRSATSLEYGELDKEVETYLNQSEQIPSRVEIGVSMDEEARSIKVCGGLLIQALPGHGHEKLERLAERMTAMPPLEELMAGGQTPEQVVERIMQGDDYLLLEKRDLTFSCSCSKERSAKALRLLDSEDQLALIAEGEAIIDCHFCHARYTFTREELVALHDEALLERRAAEEDSADHE
jgi:molecular chaperone Hsp33